MKQNITQEQLQELSPKAKEKLLSLTSWDYLPHGAQMLLHNSDFYLSDFLTIGRMIEFLGFDWIYAIGYDDEDYDDNLYFSLTLIDQEKLCDALWEAVKEKLEEE